MTDKPDLDAIEAQLASGGYGTMCKACTDRLEEVTAALREAWAENERLQEKMYHMRPPLPGGQP